MTECFARIVALLKMKHCNSLRSITYFYDIFIPNLIKFCFYLTSFIFGFNVKSRRCAKRRARCLVIALSIAKGNQRMTHFICLGDVRKYVTQPRRCFETAKIPQIIYGPNESCEKTTATLSFSSSSLTKVV